MSERMVTLTITEEHARLVQDACELLMRMKLGQTAYPVELMLGIHPNMSIEGFHKLQDIARQALDTFYIAVGAQGAVKDRDEQLAYELWGTIRHAMYLADGGKPDSWSTASCPPLSETGLKMPVCEVTRNER